MSTESDQIPSEQISSAPPEPLPEPSPPNSNNQASFPTHYHPYYPTSYNNMGYFHPPFFYNPTLNSGYAPPPPPPFPYYPTMDNNMTYAPPQFPYYQPGYSYAQPQFTSSPVYENRAPELQAPEPLPSYATTPSRALLLSLSTSDVTEATLMHELEAFGDVRALQMDRLHEGFVTAHFYDMRHAEYVVAAVCDRNKQQPPAADEVILEQVKWAKFTIPETSSIPDGYNQGTIVVFSLDQRVSSDHLKEIFEQFGPVKEVRETPHKIHQKFIEYYDVRDATAAMEQMNGKKIYDRNIVIQYGKPGGHNNKNNQDESSSVRPNRKILPPRNLPPRLRRPRQPNAAVECTLSGRVSLWKDPPPEGETNGNRGGRNYSTDQSSTNLSFTGQLEYSSSTMNENVQNLSFPARKSLRNNRFKIDEDAVMDSRTTVMIRNIPNGFRRGDLMTMLDNFCIEVNAETAVVAGEKPPSSYDYIYLPVDFRYKSNVGYAFVNMSSPKAAFKLYKAFHGQTWDIDANDSNQICEITYARIQGMTAIKNHFKNSKFPPDSDDMPVMFSPPRDGWTLTNPVPIFHCDSPPSLPQHPASPPGNASKEDQVDVPPAEGVEDENDEDGENYEFLHIHGHA